jgi:N-acetylmuramoyl-L-alanine amidase
VITQYPSLHKNARPAGVRPSAIVIHDAGARTAASTIAWFGNKLSRVSAHYLIGPDGQGYQFVPELDRAWHAGDSILEGVPNVNDYAIGIELTDPPEGASYPAPQWDALCTLVADLCTRYDIPLRRVVGHRHVCVPRGRKVDPCDAFDWFQFGIDVAHRVR